MEHDDDTVAAITVVDADQAAQVEIFPTVFLTGIHVVTEAEIVFQKRVAETLLILSRTLNLCANNVLVHLHVCIVGPSPDVEVIMSD